MRWETNSQLGPAPRGFDHQTVKLGPFDSLIRWEHGDLIIGHGLQQLQQQQQQQQQKQLVCGPKLTFHLPNMIKLEDPTLTTVLLG